MSRMPHRRVPTALTLVAGSLALVACAGAPGAGGPAAGPPDVTGVWGDPSVTDEPSLTLAEDGKLTGSDGCNRLMGSWSEADDRIDFGDVASTRMMCEGVDTWLSGLATATISGGTVTFLDASGAEIGTLERSDAPTP